MDSGTTTAHTADQAMPRTLLIVDDSAAERAVLSAAARAMGVAVVYEAANGEDALALLEQLGTAPAAMLLDLEMPVMDGIALIEQLHARGARIPTAVVSGHEAGLLQAVGLLAEQLGQPLLGARRKPLDAHTLRGLLRGALAAAAPPSAVTSFLKDPVAKGPTHSELAQAIAQGQISVHYQPKVRLDNLQPVGMEALARWMHPTLGVVPPDVFIALAERTGLIHPLTLSVLDQALREAARCDARGQALSVAVNLSPLLLETSGLVEEILQLQRRHGVAPSQITLEITESASAHQFVSAIGVLARLRLHGFRLSIDDYGTGFSSMQQLAKIPFTELKFDRSFVQGAVRHENHRVILKSSLQMCRQLGLVTVAEGIETATELALLRCYGCLVGQGWHIARPMPAEALAGWLRARSGAPAAP